MTKRKSGSARRERLPFATIAAYGPDTTLATKLAVSVFEPDQDDPTAMRTWTTATGDVRLDPVIAAAVAAFLQQHHAKAVTSDQIIGCPHEEGVDYPMGRSCPRCPFWTEIDRFTHQPIVRREPTMEPDEILEALSTDESDPLAHDALESADGHQALLVEPLLEAIDDGLADPSGASPEEATLFCYALYLLAKWREPRAYPYVIRWLSMPGEAPFDIAGDVVTQDGGRILAAVCDGDLKPIESLILDRHANEYGRSAGVTALALLAAWAEVPRQPIETFFLWLAQEGLEREPGWVWNNLAIESADIEALPLFPEIRRAYADNLIDRMAMHPSELDQVEAAPRGRLLEETRQRNPPITNVADAVAWWSFAGDSEEPEESAAPIEPYRAPPKVGRNEPCPCGSGKKFKRCCGA